MKTITELYCKFKGWKKANLHKVKKDFQQLQSSLKNDFLNVLTANATHLDICEAHKAQWFKYN